MLRTDDAKYLLRLGLDLGPGVGPPLSPQVAALPST
jgi:hypothetical protein